jgi:archaemetzincin
MMFMVCLGAGVEMAKFTPPDEKVRVGAIGDTSKLSGALRRAFSDVPKGAFAAIPAPGAHDWLANHAEEGQTYEQWVASKPNVPDRVRTTLYLQPIGVVPENRRAVLPKLKAFSEAFFQMPVKVEEPMALKEGEVTSRKNSQTNQKQLLSGDVLEVLKKRVPADGYAVLGVTFVDLYPDPKWNFVFGQAALRDRVGVYSFARYDPKFYGEKGGSDTEQLVLQRACKVLAHETCHMFGIQHCVYFSCLMNGSNHLQEADGRPLHLCPVDLRKLQRAVGFDVVKRYEALRDFWNAEGDAGEVKWLEGRLMGYERGVIERAKTSQAKSSAKRRSNLGLGRCSDHSKTA